jgi:hypothetical protein
MHAPVLDTDSKIDAAIDALNPTMALMALIQITGDRTLLNHYWNAIDGRQEELIESARRSILQWRLRSATGSVRR